MNATLGDVKATLGDRRLAEVRFPGQKVLIQESEDRLRAARRTYYASPGALVSVLMFDGSVEARKTADANPGWDPNEPNSPQTMRFVYLPRAWEAPPTGSGTQEVVAWGTAQSDPTVHSIRTPAC